MLVIGKEGGGGGGVRSLAWLGTGWIPLPGERVESFGGKGDIYIPVPVVSVVRIQLGCIVGQKVRVLRDDW